LNGVNLSRQKLASVRANYFNDWKEDDLLECRYLDPHKDGGPVWNIFYLHCRQPQRYPIYDQNTYRAMIYIRERVICDTFPENSPEFVYESYKQSYRPFVDDIRGMADRDLRTIDRALYTFGQFLKSAKPFWNYVAR
jgi:hypothetical protein